MFGDEKRKFYEEMTKNLFEIAAEVAKSPVVVTKKNGSVVVDVIRDKEGMFPLGGFHGDEEVLYLGHRAIVCLNPHFSRQVPLESNQPRKAAEELVEKVMAVKYSLELDGDRTLGGRFAQAEVTKVNRNGEVHRILFEATASLRSKPLGVQMREGFELHKNLNTVTVIEEPEVELAPRSTVIEIPLEAVQAARPGQIVFPKDRYNQAWSDMVNLYISSAWRKVK